MHVGFKNQSKVSYQLYDNDNIQEGRSTVVRSILQKADEVIKKYRPSKATLGVRWVLVVTWFKVFPFSSGNTNEVSHHFLN